MTEVQLEAFDRLMTLEATGHAHNLIQSIRLEWEFNGNQSGWIESHVTTVEGDDSMKVAQNATESMANEVRGIVFDAMHNGLNA